MLKLSIGSRRVYDLRTRINPTNLLPYFARLETVQSKRYFYQHSYTFEKTHFMKTNLSTCLPLVSGSQMEWTFLTLIYQYMELDPFIEPSQEVFVNPIRISVSTNGAIPLQTYIDEQHQGLLCVSRENVTGGMYKTSEFERELVPMELIIGTQPTLSSLEKYNANLPESYMDIVLFSKK
jgi:hypothetical protein